jgi:Protein of unknown function (DUF3592)
MSGDLNLGTGTNISDYVYQDPRQVTHLLLRNWRSYLASVPPSQPFARRFDIALLLHRYCPGKAPEDHEDMNMDPSRGLGPSFIYAFISDPLATLSIMTSALARIIAYVFVGILCAVGPVMLLISAGTGLKRALFVRSSLSAEGVVVALRYVRSSSKPMSQTCSPIFRFTAKNGTSFTVTSNIAQSPSPWRPGDSVRVLYQEDYPENAHIDSFVQLWEPQVILGIVGGICSVFPLLIFLRRRRSSN